MTHLRRRHLRLTATHRPPESIRQEQGFTLFELLIVIAVMPIIVGGISVALISVLTQQKTVNNKVSDSGDATVVSANFVRDVQSAAKATTSSSNSLSPGQCGPTSTAILSLQLGNLASASTVTYDVEQQGTTSVYSLVRYYCPGGTSTPSDRTVVSHDVQNTLGALIGGKSCDPITLACNSSPNWSGGWLPTDGVSGISISVNAPLSNYSYILTGAPRVSTPASRGNQTPPGFAPLLTLPGGSGVTCSGTGSINVNGTATVDSGTPPASTNGGGKIKATQFYTDLPTSPNPFGSSNITPSPPTGQGTAGDPFAGLVPPATGLLSANLTVGGEYEGYPVYGGTYSGPGIYTQTLSSFPTNPQVFQSGVYILMNGFRDNNTQRIQSATTGGVDGNGGLLFYVVGGSFDMEGQGGATLAPFNLAPPVYQNAPSPWPGIVIWQDGPGTQGPSDPGDNNTLKLTGGSAATFITGAVYAPAATVGGGGGASLNVGSIVSLGVTCAGGGAMNVG
jgi:prepilin-type N-terminal cleavage/methylation domain-containing protein